MPVSLAKGQNVSLEKASPGLKLILVGLGWDARATDGQPFDLDASAFLLTADGRVRNGADFIFYNNLKSADGSIEHSGDNRDGLGSGDDEAVKVNLASVPAEVQKISFAATIHEAEQRHQNFGQVSNAFIRIVNQEGGQEIARFDLSEDCDVETAMVFGELYRHAGEWKFKAIGQGFAGGLSALAKNFGVEV
ncbi:MAG: TerD family protein [Deltaproteobacteria bacterium]|jgi:tellurium resistance protein TerD|nr:TerD family protein [Deltaproteobacteria bacterium]